MNVVWALSNVPSQTSELLARLVLVHVRPELFVQQAPQPAVSMDLAQKVWLPVLEEPEFRTTIVEPQFLVLMELGLQMAYVALQSIVHWANFCAPTMLA